MSRGARDCDEPGKRLKTNNYSDKSGGVTSDLAGTTWRDRTIDMENTDRGDYGYCKNFKAYTRRTENARSQGRVPDPEQSPGKSSRTTPDREMLATELW